jgi:PhnB protein
MAKKKAKKVVKKKAPKKAVKKASKKSAKKAPLTPQPQGVTINPYLTFNGNCEEAFNFYKSVFGGKFAYLGRFKEMPPMEGMPVNSDDADKIMHVSLPIGGGTVLMGSDSSESFGKATVEGNNFSVSINAPSQAKADKLFEGLANGGQVTMPMSQTFWGSYFGMLKDKYGIQWMVSFDAKPTS